MSKLLAGLNPSQREAVTHTIGPLLIIAGPGSGKTRTVVRSIAYAIEILGVLPDKILAFSFTVKASRELKERVTKFVGKEKGRLVNISTFHSFCREVLKEDLGRLHGGYAPNSQNLDEDEQEKEDRRRVAQAINDLQYESVKLEEVHNFIIKCKLGVLPSKTGNSEYAKIYDRYEQRLKEDGWIDYSNQLRFTDELFSDVPTVKEKWQEKFDLIFVDEYQDTNRVQYRIIKALAEKHQNLRVVGDDDQGIYGWRGADIQNILNFENDYPTAKLTDKPIKLEQNYRSTQRIVEASRALVEFNPDRRDKDLFTRNLEGEKVKHLHCENANVEAETIADFISRAIKKGRDPSDFAVLYRLNKQVGPFKTAFKQLEILFHEVKKPSDRDAPGVSLMTIHKSKGLEFPNVFVVGVCEDLLPNYYSRHEKDWGEELRLLYVAMTRAKNWLCLSSYDYDDEHKRGQSPFFQRGYIDVSLLESVETLRKTAVPPIPEEMIAQNAVEQSDAPVEPLPISPQTVIGIDPGNIGANTTNVGWSVTQKSADGYSVLCFGNENPKGTPENRLEEIKQKIDKLIEKYSPPGIAGIAVERIEIGVEATIEDWFLYVAGCVTAIRSIAAQHKIECHLYTPKQVKYIATSNRNALKKDVQYGVKRVCDLSEIPEPDHSADAIAASLCYLRSYLNSSRFDGNKQKEERWNNGCVYLDESQYDAAVSEFRETINIDPIYPDAHYGLGRAYLGQANLIEAENSAKETLRLDKNYQQAHNLLEDIRRSYYNQGCEHLDNQRYNEAIAAFNEVIDRDSNFIDAYCGLGRTYFMQGRWKDAENYVDKALRLDPNYKPALESLEEIKKAYYNRGCNHLDNQRYNEAIAAFNEVIDRDSNFIDAYCGLSRAYLEQQRLDIARRAANAALRIDENYPPVQKLLVEIKKRYYNNGEISFNREEYTQAISEFQKAVEIDQNFKDAHCFIGEAYLKLEDLGRAETSTRKALLVDSNYELAKELLEKIKQRHKADGDNHLNRRDYSEALRSYRHAIRIDNKYKEAYNSLGRVRFERQEYSIAIRVYQRAISIDDRYRVAHNNIGVVYLKIGEYDRAANSLRRAIEINSDCPKTYHNLALTYFKMENLPEASEAVLNALERGANSQRTFELVRNIQDAYLEKGRDYFREDNLEAAKISARAALRLDPNYQPAHELLENIKRVYYERALGCIENSMYDDAISVLQKSIEIDPEFKEAHYSLGKTYFKRGNIEAAERKAGEALRIDRNYEPASSLLVSIKKEYCSRASASLEQNEWQAAEKFAKEALRIDPEYQPANVLLQAAYLEQGIAHTENERYVEGINKLQEAKNIDPNCEKTHYYLGRAYFKSDRLEDAQMMVEEALSIQPNYPLAQKLLRDIKDARNWVKVGGAKVRELARWIANRIGF